MSVTPLRQPSASDATVGDPPNELSDSPTVVDKHEKTKPSRGQSTIAFPYVDLGEALLVARTIVDKGGSPLTREQLCAALGHKTMTGAFSAKIHAAKMFGFVDIVDSKVKITNLGFDAIDDDDARSRPAKAKAFLNVPLFERVRNEFRNSKLPPRPHGLEQAMVDFGVLETRKTNARWSFEKSAKQAGYFDHGDDRLVEPIVAEPLTKIEDEPQPQRSRDNVVSTPSSITATDGKHELITGLFKSIPPDGTPWSTADQVNWLQLAATIFRVLHGTRGEIEIRVRQNSDGKSEA